ncbi:MAG: CHAD domain-containing protein [Cyanobacteria bacterium J06635_1]
MAVPQKVSQAVSTGSTLSEQVAARPHSLGIYAYQTLRKHFKKATKYKSQVLKDTDPEALHQMRVGLRRLRTAVEIFGGAIELPEGVGDRNIAKIARRLGSVRDLDVLLMWLQTFRQEHDLGATEIKALQTVEANILKHRQKCFRRARKLLKSKEYDALTTALKGWLKQPCYQLSALLPIDMVLPDLLSPLVGEVLQHPGWLVGTAQTLPLRPRKRMSLPLINQCLNDQGGMLHDLRKRMKHVRYQSEFFLGLHGLSYASLVKGFRNIQDTLGILQDEAVIQAVLQQSLGDDWSTQIPTLAQYFDQERRQMWKHWQALQIQYLDPAFRHHLRQQMLAQKSLQLEDGLYSVSKEDGEP